MASSISSSTLQIYLSTAWISSETLQMYLTTAWISSHTLTFLMTPWNLSRPLQFFLRQHRLLATLLHLLYYLHTWRLDLFWNSSNTFMTTWASSQPLKLSLCQLRSLLELSQHSLFQPPLQCTPVLCPAPRCWEPTTLTLPVELHLQQARCWEPTTLTLHVELHLLQPFQHSPENASRPMLDYIKPRECFLRRTATQLPLSITPHLDYLVLLFPASH